MHRPLAIIELVFNLFILSVKSLAHTTQSPDAQLPILPSFVQVPPEGICIFIRQCQLREIVQFSYRSCQSEASEGKHSHEGETHGCRDLIGIGTGNEERSVSSERTRASNRGKLIPLGKQLWFWFSLHHVLDDFQSCYVFQCIMKFPLAINNSRQMHTPFSISILNG